MKFDEWWEREHPATDTKFNYQLCWDAALVNLEDCDGYSMGKECIVYNDFRCASKPCKIDFRNAGEK